MILRNRQITIKSWDVIKIHRLILLFINILISILKFYQNQIEQITLEFKLRALQDHPDKNSNSNSASKLKKVF